MKKNYSPAVEYLSAHMEQRLKNREYWRKEAGNLIDAHQLAVSAITSCTSRLSGRTFENEDSSLQGRMSLTAQFLQGIDLCESSITEGLYSQAAALLKQEMETLEAINEFENGKRQDGRTPKLSLLKDFGRIYGKYNEFAHVSIESIARHIVQIENGNLRAPSLLPIFKADIAISFYGMHVFFITLLAMQFHSIFSELFNEGLNDEEFKWLFLAIKTLEIEEIIKIAE